MYYRNVVQGCPPGARRQVCLWLLRSVHIRKRFTTMYHVVAGAIHIDTANAQGVHFSTPYYQTGYRLVVPKRTDDGNWFHFKDVFDDWMWVIGIFVECLFVGVLLFLMESPEMSYNQGKIWKGKTSSQDTDVVPGTIAGLLDCWYWALSTYTT